MSEHSWKDIDIEVPWVFIPLRHDDAMKIYFWIKRMPATKEADDALSKECEEVICREFKALGLKYDTEKYGSVEMENLRLLSGSDGIAIPESCFVDPDENLQRITNPLRPLIS